MTTPLTRRRLLACSGALLLARALPARAAGPLEGPPSTPLGDAAPMPEALQLARAIGPRVVLLNAAAARDIMQRALDFGQVLARTGNAGAVMERSGVAMRLEREGGAPAGADSGQQGGNLAGGYVGGDIDLRFNFDQWRHAFAVTQRGNDGGEARSLRFFDAQGHAVHRLTLRNQAAGGLFDKLALDFRAPDQSPSHVTIAAPQRPDDKADSAIDVRAFRQAWLAMADPGQFGAIAAEFGVTREQALRLAPPGMAQRLAPHAARALLDAVVQHKLPIVALVGNAGITQLYTGTLGGAGADGLDYVAQAPDLTLRLRDSRFRSGYVVRRAGAVSVEYFDPDGEPAVAFSGVRERNRPQAWMEVALGLPKA